MSPANATYKMGELAADIFGRELGECGCAQSTITLARVAMARYTLTTPNGFGRRTGKGCCHPSVNWGRCIGFATTEQAPQQGEQCGEAMHGLLVQEAAQVV